MSWHYLQAEEAVSSDHISWDGKRFVPSKSKTNLGEYCSRDSGMGTCLGSPYGTMLEHSMACRGAGESISLQEGSRVLTSAQQDQGSGLMGENLDYGVRWHELSVRYDRATSSWKTHRTLFEEVLQWSLVILPKWGMMRDGVLFRRATPVRFTNANDAGFLPTLTVKGNYNRRGASLKSGDGLATAVKRMPTLTASDATGGPGSSGRAGGYNLRTLVKRLPTLLARDYRTGKSTSGDNPHKTRNLNDKFGGCLSPTWCEWFMGWPIGWTDLNPMPEFRIIPLGQDPACSGKIERLVQPRSIKRIPARIKMLGNG